MITRFDRDGTIAHYKKKFSQCIDDCDFEGAIDYLLKYRDECDNDDFHLTCGMLYLQLSLDSDDNELITLAYRELMMYLSFHPDSENAYRNILAALLLRRDGRAFVGWCKYIKDRGLDFEKIIGELADCGALFIASNSEPPDFDMLFDGEYGEIESATYADEKEQALFAEPPLAKQKSKVIAFAKKPADEYAARVMSVASDGRALSDGDIADGVIFREVPTADTEHADGGRAYDGEFDDFINAYLYGESYDEEDEDAVLDAAGMSAQDGQVPTIHVDAFVKKAEEAFENGDLDAALDVLANVKKSDESYLFSLIMRANILIVCGKYDEAERALDEVMAVMPHSAMAGSLLCRLYELQGRTELIPQALLNIDVGDYINYAHLFKSFDMALKYCDYETLAKLLREYIDEFNIMEMRLVYAQVMYNLGERDYALSELYSISRVFYDDINAQIMYRAAKEGVPKFMLSAEAPQETLAVVVDGVLSAAFSGYVDDMLADTDMMSQSIEFFLTLEFRSANRLLSEMFDAVRLLAKSESGEKRMREAIVSPYIEPIVKAVILGELLCRAPRKHFLVDISYLPVSDDGVPTLRDGLSAGCYIAYAFVLLLCRTRLDELIKLVETTDFSRAKDVTERAKALYLVKTACGKALDDQRLPLALGYPSKAAATREYRTLSREIG